MDQTPLLERHRVLGVLLTLGVLVLVGWAGGSIVGVLLVRIAELALGTVSGGS